MTKIETPELDKMMAVKDTSQQIGEFIEWLSTQEMWIGQYVDLGYREPRGVPVSRSINELLADYYEIDLIAVEHERRAILAALQEVPPRTTTHADEERRQALERGEQA